MISTLSRRAQMIVVGNEEHKEENLIEVRVIE